LSESCFYNRGVSLESEDGFKTGSTLKMAVFLVVAPCTDISEVLAASIIRAIRASTSETSVNFYQVARPNNSEDRI
jgi:hypothetical protein